MSLANARQQFPHLKDYTDQELLSIVAQSNSIQEGTPQYKKLESDLLGYDRTLGEKVKDTGVQLGQGLLGLGKTVSTIVSAATPGLSAFDNPVSTYLGEASQGMEQYKSQGLRNQKAGAAVNSDIARRQYARPTDSMVDTFLNDAGAQVQNYWNAPGLLAEDIVTNAPQLLVGGLAGRGAGALAKAAGAGEKGVRAAAISGAYGTNAAMQGADIGKDTYDRLIAAGVAPEQATALATEAAVKAGAVSLATNAAVPGGGLSERILLGNAGRVVAGGGLARGLARAGGDMASEAVEEGYGRFAGNQAVQTVDANINLMDGVGSSAVMGAAASGPISIYGGLRSRGLPAPVAPRTETGEIDLAGAPVGPNPLDVPAFERRGLDPLNERSSPYPMVPDRTMADIAGDLLVPPTPEAAAYTDLVAPAAPAPELDPYSATFAAQDAEGQARAQAAQVQVQEARRAAAETGTSAQGPGVMVATPDGTVLPAQSPEQMQETERARQALESQPAADITAAAPEQTGPLNRGQLLVALQKANTELGKNTVKKDGEIANTRGTAPLREVLEAADPLTAMRELHQDGNAPRDELIDNWHKNLTGQTVFEWKTAQAPAVEAAPIVEAPNVQLDDTDAGNGDGPQSSAQDVAPLGADQPVGGEPVGQPSAERRAVPRAPAASAGVDIPGANATADTQPALTPAAAPKAKAPKYGRRPSAELIEIADNTKDEDEYTEARYELYRRWANDTDEGVSEAYLLDGKDPAKFTDRPEIKEFQKRYEAELAAKETKRGQKLGKKFGVDDGSKVALGTGEVRDTNNPDNGIDPLTEQDIVGITDGKSAAAWLIANAKNPWHRQIAKLIAPYISEGVTTHFVQAGDVMSGIVAEHLNGSAMAVAYLTRDGNYELFYRTDKNLNESILLHELVHAATMKALRANLNIPLRNEMRKLGKAIKQSFKDVRDNPRAPMEDREKAKFMDAVLVDENELLAYAFSSPTMRKWMENMNADGKFVPFNKYPSELRSKAQRRVPGVPPVTTWQKFTDLIRKLFGVAPVNQLAFERMLADREDQIAGIVEAGRDTSLYNTLDDFLQRAMDAQAEQNAEAGQEQAAAATDSTLVNSFSNAAKAVTAAARAQSSGKEISSTLLKAMTLRQIDEQFGKRLPALRDWIGAIMQRGSNASKLAAEADRVALQWEKSVKDPAERKALADVLLRASVAELELDNTTVKYLSTLDAKSRAEHTALRAKLAALSPEAQKTRQQALAILSRQWEYTRSSLESFINHTLPDPGLRNARIEDLKREMGRSRGDYFPLSRFGNRIVIGTAAAADGRDVVSFHESAASAEAEVQRLKLAGVKKIVSTLQTDRDSRQRASTGFMGSLHQMIDGSDADGSIKDSMHEALQQLYLKSLPELSGAKHMIRRENVEGFSEDALRVFADSVTRGARYASHLEFGPTIQAAMEAAASQSQSSDKRTAAVVIGRKDGEAPVVRAVPTGTDRLNAVNEMTAAGYAVEFFNTIPESARERLAGALQGATKQQLDAHVAAVEQVVGRTVEGVEDMRAAKALYNHMIGLQKTEGDQDPSAVVEALGQVGYTWFLGFSPAFWMMNTLQNPMIGIPHLGAKYGVGKAAAEWTGAMKWFGGVRIGKLMSDGKTPFSVEWIKDQVKAGKLSGISKQELDMLQALEDKQVLDFTQAMDLSRIGQASNDTRYKFMRLAAAGAHHTEVFNRVTFALAAYRLAMKSSGSVTHAEAIRRAENDTAAVHFDYSYANKPEMMRGKSTRLVFMFQQYRQHMLYWWAKNIKDMVKNESPGDRTRAAKAALLMGTTQGIFAGALGLPFVGSIAFLANMLGGDDDEGVPFDFNTWILEAATDATGSAEAGEVMAKGIFAAMGMNIGQRIGQADLLPFLNEGSAKFERNADDKMRAYLFDLMGPLGSIALGTARATEAFGRGDTAGGIAATTPKAVADLVKAYQLETEGMKDKKGQFLATAEAFDGADVFMQAAGVAPTRVANIRADKGKVANIDNALKTRTRELTGQFVEAWLRSDRDGVMEAVEGIKQFNQKAGAKFKDKSMLIDGRQLEMAIKDRQQRAMLLALTGGTAETKRQLLIATRMSGLFNPVTPGSMKENAANGLPGLPGLPAGD